MAGISILHNEKNVKTFAAGEHIFEQGHIGNEMYGVLEGQVEIVLNGKVVETVDDGGIFGELAIIDTHIRSAAAVAKTNCRLAAIDQKRFTFLIQQTPYFAIQVMQVMADRLKRWGA